MPASPLNAAHVYRACNTPAVHAQPRLTPLTHTRTHHLRTLHYHLCCAPQDLATSLTAWRAEAAAAGHLPVLTSLSQAEVSGLSGPQAEGLARAMMRLEARGNLLLRKAAARALQLGQLDAGDAAALAWKVHTGGAAAAEEVVRVLLQQVGGAGWVVRQQLKLDP